MKFPNLIHGYTPVDQRVAPEAQSRLAKKQNLLIILIISLLSILLGLMTGSLLCAELSHCKRTHILQEPNISIDEALTFIETSFTYNRTFGADPFVNKATNEAWDSIVPLGQGTVEYPSNTSRYYTLSVVHQLHCLFSLHQSLYAALNSGFGNADFASSHIRHCFDYLRQSLTCAADMTLEPVDPVLAGVTGWNNGRICRNYTAVTAWAEEHRASNLRGFSHESVP